MAKKGKPTKAEAIRLAIEAGGCGDYCDVVEEVKRRYGLTVGEGQVESTYRAMQEKALVGGNSQGTLAMREELLASADTGKADRRVKALRFVQAMGGFGAAREALSELEKELKRLLK